MQALEIKNYTLSTCLGAGAAANWEKLAAQQGGLKPCDFETVDLPTYIGEVPGVDAIVMRAGLEKFDCRNNRLVQLALQQDGFIEAVRQAIRQYGADRIGLFVGGSSSGILQTELAYRNRQTVDGVAGGALPEDFHYQQTHNMHSAGAFVSAFLGLTGPTLTVSSACSSSAKVFGNAARMIEAGLIDAAVVGGVDSLCLTTLYGFNSLQLLSPEPARPYGEERNGISIAEGAAFALLTKPDSLTARGTILLQGVGESSDAHHMSSPHPEGLGARMAMQSALLSAGIEASHIGYINLHGTATPSNDAAEGKAVHALFGDSTPCSSTKGATGHTLGAAGIVEAIICMMAMQHQVLPAGINTNKIDPQFDINYVLANRPANIRYALNNSFGFGGSNCSLVLGIAQ
ncbi:MAG TPA: beta-ketoacyl-[acyl-carrier-protein] synthase family protein [Herminiimonas sp.]|jgi:3-oxoacyl-[acyl-carrier-protein] synthase-1|nr:beta-ketoacyl-[acyl-carrier-protein] synthase family protein [Herminiimonas sp.]